MTPRTRFSSLTRGTSFAPQRASPRHREDLLMNSTRTSATATLTFRQMAPRDLLQVWRIEQQTAVRRWTVQDFLTVLQSGHTGGQIAEVGDQVIGYIIYTVQSVPKEDAVPSDSIHTPFAGPHA